MTIEIQYDDDVLTIIDKVNEALKLSQLYFEYEPDSEDDGVVMFHLKQRKWS